MTEEQQKALQMLVEGLAHFDSYRPVPSDDCPVLADDHQSLYEFAGAAEGCLRVGHLRAIASLVTEES